MQAAQQEKEWADYLFRDGSMIGLSDNVQVAPQEVEVSSYLVGQIDSEVNTDDLSDFQL
ncbi:ribonucleoside-diphosphate reductase class Ia beta subunit [Enterobacter cloacae]|nr:ribonucleoside-diphosphate reductase class Ia beta subunit [Enterobacter cloacae]